MSSDRLMNKKEVRQGDLSMFEIIDYYAPPSRPEGPRRCPDKGNAGGALVFSSLLWLLYALGLYT